MVIILAVASGFCWAITDYLAARAGRRIPGVVVTMYLQILGAVLLMPLLATGHWTPTGRDLLFGLLAGLINAVGWSLFVVGVSRHAIGIVVPVSAAVGAAVPVIAGLFFGDQFGYLSGLGLALAIVAIVLISISQETRNELTDKRILVTGLDFGLITGVMFGLMFVLIGRTSEESGLWPIFAMRLSVVVLLSYVLSKRIPVKVPINTFPLILVLTIVGVGGLSLFSFAARIGPLGVAAVIANMSPLGTVVLARIFDREVITKLQVVGIAAALVAVGLLSV